MAFLFFLCLLFLFLFFYFYFYFFIFVFLFLFFCFFVLSFPRRRESILFLFYLFLSLRSLRSFAVNFFFCFLSFPRGTAVLHGEGGIRTRGTLAGTRHFQCRTIGRSVTSPTCRVSETLYHFPARETRFRRTEKGATLQRTRPLASVANTTANVANTTASAASTDPTETRTPVAGMKTRCPRPLDDGADKAPSWKCPSL